MESFPISRYVVWLVWIVLIPLQGINKNRQMIEISVQIREGAVVVYENNQRNLTGTLQASNPIPVSHAKEL